MENMDLNIPIKKEINEVNDTTAAAIEEGQRIAYDPSVRGYTSIEDLKKELETEHPL